MAADRQDLRRRLTTIAATQSGYFTAQQALRAGYTYQAQKYHADRGNWARVERGIFRLPEWPVGRHDDLVRWFLWSRGRAVISHETALSVHELGDANPAVVHLTVPPGFRARAHGVRLHPGVVPDRDVLNYEGLRVTTPLRTLLDVAAGNLDLDQLSIAIDDAVALGVLTTRALWTRADEFGPHAALRIERALTIRNAP